eukprot:94705-Pelagomonas_calceolata.AAC.4
MHDVKPSALPSCYLPTHLLADQAPQLVQVHDGVVVLVLVQGVVPHTDLQVGAGRQVWGRGWVSERCARSGVLHDTGYAVAA